MANAAERAHYHQKTAGLELAGVVFLVDIDAEWAGLNGAAQERGDVASLQGGELSLRQGPTKSRPSRLDNLFYDHMREPWTSLAA
jgi:hypothetical protein